MSLAVLFKCWIVHGVRRLPVVTDSDLLFIVALFHVFYGVIAGADDGGLVGRRADPAEHDGQEEQTVEQTDRHHQEKHLNTARLKQSMHNVLPHTSAS